MSKERRADLFLGIILFLAGGWILASQYYILPGWLEIINVKYQWPFIVIGVGVFLFLLGLITRTPELSVPACIVGGIGGILYWTSMIGSWSDWSFLWTLIPGFVGVGSILSSLLGGTRNYFEGLWLIIVSLVLFILFFVIFSGRGDLIQYWPILVILAGIWIIIQTIFHKR